MHDDLGEVLCATCASYGHPFLEACPVCGAQRESRYAAAMTAPDQGFAALPFDPRVAREVSEVVLRYTLTRGGGSPTADFHEGLATVAGALAYRLRVAGDPAAGSDRGRLEIGEMDLVVRERPARERVRVSLDAILAVSPAARGRPADAWSGLAFEDRREQTSPPRLDGDLVIAHATPTGLARIALANPPGILAARARPDHYAILARWIGIAAAAATERRWTVVGPRRHAHELGLATAPPGGWPAPVADAAADAPSVADALRLLEELRTAGLVSDGEYAAKRREILDRI